MLGATAYAKYPFAGVDEEIDESSNILIVSYHINERTSINTPTNLWDEIIDDGYVFTTDSGPIRPPQIKTDYNFEKLIDVRKGDTDVLITRFVIDHLTAGELDFTYTNGYGQAYYKASELKSPIKINALAYFKHKVILRVLDKDLVTKQIITNYSEYIPKTTVWTLNGIWKLHPQKVIMENDDKIVMEYGFKIKTIKQGKVLVGYRFKSDILRRYSSNEVI
jgi:hypothetical protein